MPSSSQIETEQTSCFIKSFILCFISFSFFFPFQTEFCFKAIKPQLRSLLLVYVSERRSRVFVTAALIVAVSSPTGYLSSWRAVVWWAACLLSRSRWHDEPRRILIPSHDVWEQLLTALLRATVGFRTCHHSYFWSILLPFSSLLICTLLHSRR